MTTKPTTDRAPKLTRKEASEAILADIADELMLLGYHFKALSAKVRLATQEINTAESSEKP